MIIARAVTARAAVVKAQGKVSSSPISPPFRERSLVRNFAKMLQSPVSWVIG